MAPQFGASLDVTITIVEVSFMLLDVSFMLLEVSFMLLEVSFTLLEENFNSTGHSGYNHSMLIVQATIYAVI